MISKEKFCSQIKILRKFGSWDILLNYHGINLIDTPVGDLAEELYKSIVDYDTDWDYDQIFDRSWVNEVCYNDDFYNVYYSDERAGKTWWWSFAEN